MDQNSGSSGGGSGGSGANRDTDLGREAEAARRIEEEAKRKAGTDVPGPTTSTGPEPAAEKPVTSADIQKMLEFFSTAIGRALGDHWELGPNESEYYAEVIAKQGPDFLKTFNPKLLFWVATALIVIPRLYETGVLIAARIKSKKEAPASNDAAKGEDDAAIEFPEPRGATRTRKPVDLSTSEGQHTIDRVPTSKGKDLGPTA